MSRYSALVKQLSFRVAGMRVRRERGSLRGESGDQRGSGFGFDRMRVRVFRGHGKLYHIILIQ